MDYYLCDSDSPDGLSALVNDYLGRGYQLYGDVAMYSLPNGTVRYNQAMTRQIQQAAPPPAPIASPKASEPSEKAPSK